MLSTAAKPVDLTLDNKDDWIPKEPSALYRTASVGSWGVTSIGRGFDWDQRDENPVNRKDPNSAPDSPIAAPKARRVMSFITDEPRLAPSPNNSLLAPQRISPSHAPPLLTSHASFQEPASYFSLPNSRPSSRVGLAVAIGSRPSSKSQSLASSPTFPPRTPGTPRPRRRSSQQRVSLVAGRLLLAPLEPPSPKQQLHRLDSSNSLLAAPSAGPPSPLPDESFLGDRTISNFQIEGEIGRGAYGLVKKAREKLPDGTLGPSLILKQIIKSRILADCWKRHPQFGTIPIEIYVMTAISNTSYILPARRPWDPSRFGNRPDGADWVEGKAIKGHPNICPLLDFFEDSHYYYLVLPSSSPEPIPRAPTQPGDLFDLVEAHPQGLPPSSIRTYLGQIADALGFLHSHGIVHRDLKDENVVLAKGGNCILIDFGSSGLVKKNGWDTFSGTLDYAGPEILRGERYFGREQDVWAFGVVAYVLLVGECPFLTAAEAQEGLVSPFCNASIALDERCDSRDGEEGDGGGALEDAAALVKACLQLKVSVRPTVEQIMQSKFLKGNGGWGAEVPFVNTNI